MSHSTVVILVISSAWLVYAVARVLDDEFIVRRRRK